MKRTSKYLKYFKEHPGVQFMGDILLVERIPQEEIKTSSGLIMAAVDPRTQWNSMSVDRPHWAIVLACGQGYYDDDTKEPIPLDTKPGDIILIGQISAKYFSTLEVLNEVAGFKETYLPDTVGVTRESEILAKISGSVD